jgi:hypothetical protein
MPEIQAVLLNGYLWSMGLYGSLGGNAIRWSSLELEGTSKGKY